MRVGITVSIAVNLVAGVVVGPALAHTTERAFVLVLPTELYLTGGTLAVALSFVVLTCTSTMRETRARVGCSCAFPKSNC